MLSSLPTPTSASSAGPLYVSSSHPVAMTAPGEDTPPPESPPNAASTVPMPPDGTSPSSPHSLECPNPPSSPPPPPPQCSACSLPIQDRYLLSVLDRLWHERCLRCALCGHLLTRSCYVKDRTLYCKLDYFRLFSVKCTSCHGPIAPSELVMRVQGSIYHTGCFSCARCGRELTKGDEFSVRRGRLLCREHLETVLGTGGHYGEPHSPEHTGNTAPPLSPGDGSEASYLGPHTPSGSSELGPLDARYSPRTSHGSTPADGFQADFPTAVSVTNSTSKSKTGPLKQDGRRGPKRPRTILTTSQRRAFKASFEISPKPCRKVRESLAKETGLNVRIVQVWFQNQRAKLKKIQRKQAQLGITGGSSSSGRFVGGGSNGSESGGGLGGSHSSDKSNDDSTDEEDDDSSAMENLQNSNLVADESYLHPGPDLAGLDDSSTSYYELDQQGQPSFHSSPSHLPHPSEAHFLHTHHPLESHTSSPTPGHTAHSPAENSNVHLTHLDKLYQVCTNYVLFSKSEDFPPYALHSGSNSNSNSNGNSSNSSNKRNHCTNYLGDL